MGLKKIFWAIALSLVLLPVSPVMADSTTVNNIAERKSQLVKLMQRVKGKSGNG